VPHLSSDVTRKRLAGLEPGEAGPPELYTDEASRRTYAELGRLAAAAVTAEDGAVVDATFRRRADRESFRDGAGTVVDTAVFVECRAPVAVLLERTGTRERAADEASDATSGIVERQIFEPLDEVQPGFHFVLRGDRPVEEAIADLEAALDARLLGGALGVAGGRG
jgi:predicted kinase